MLKRKRIIIGLGIIFVLLLFFIGFIKQQYVVPILMYHSVYPDARYENRISVSTKTFEGQMRFLKKNNYNILPLEKLAELIRNKEKIPYKTIVITFDDGFKDNYTYAFPILKKYTIPATVFIIVNEIGRPQGDRMTLDQLKEMQSSGLVTFGSHTLGPVPLVEIKSEEELRKQIFESKKLLAQKLGRAVFTFSYPHGEFNDRIRQMVIDAGYKAAVSTSPGREYPDDDIFALKRLRIAENARNLFIFWVQASGYYTFTKEKHRK